MIHSLSGGVIKDYGAYTFVKVIFEADDRPYWYIADFPVEEGDKVIAPFGKIDTPREATAIKVEKNVSGQVTPIPLNSAKKLLGLAPRA